MLASVPVSHRAVIKVPFTQIAVVGLFSILVLPILQQSMDITLRTLFQGGREAVLLPPFTSFPNGRRTLAQFHPLLRKLLPSHLLAIRLHRGSDRTTLADCLSSNPDLPLKAVQSS